MVMCGYAVTITNTYTPKPSSSISSGTIEEVMPFAAPSSDVVTQIAIGTQILNNHRAKINAGKAYSANTDLSISGNSYTGNALITTQSNKRVSNSAAVPLRALVGNVASASLNAPIADRSPMAYALAIEAYDFDWGDVDNNDGEPDGPSLGELPIQDAWLWMVLLMAGYGVVVMRRRREK